jgi:hypothetical protein
MIFEGGRNHDDPVAIAVEKPGNPRQSAMQQ